MSSRSPLATGERHALLGGLFATTLATLLLEQLDARLLSVATWYHLAFFAVSLAMLGMAAGAVRVFLAGASMEGEAARRALPRHAIALSISIVLGHLVLVWVPIYSLRELAALEIASLALATVALAAPFYLSGIVVTLALTRISDEIGLIYAVDLLGAALGCLLVVPLLAAADLSSAMLATAALAAIGARGFSHLSGAVPSRTSSVLAAGLLLAAVANVVLGAPLSLQWSKGRRIERQALAYEGWNDHSYVTASASREAKPFYWGRGRSPELPRVEQSLLLIDGSAGTPLTRWNAETDSIDWVQYDVTALAHLLRHGTTAVIGVGGGRDVLAALWSGADHVVGIELNAQLLHLLRGPFRDYAAIAGDPRVELIHAEARSYLTREERQFDLIQMSLIDTWASTGAGAYSLSENGLYTVEAWTVLLDRLAPQGLLSVSRWFAPSALSETSRLLSLAVSALIERGIGTPADHLMLVTRGPVATLIASPDAIGPADIARVREIADAFDYDVRALPGAPPEDARLASILASRSQAELAEATAHPMLDYSAPTDERPYFFNLLRPAGFREAFALRAFRDAELAGGVLLGNARATATLLVLLAIALALTSALIAVPLWRRGLPAMGSRRFVCACAYFALIGMGYMLVQIPALQRFSIYLGHPTWTLAVVLFAMILFSGVGSLFSDRLPDPAPAIGRIPLAAAAAIAALALVAPPVIGLTIAAPLWVRCALVVVLLAPIALLLGFCFPLGLRAVAAHSTDATAWMWGINGAFGVLASILAVLVSIAFGITIAWILSAGLYAALSFVGSRLARA